jgi:hypothetical protein
VTETDTFTNLMSTLEATPWWGQGGTNAIGFVNAVGNAFGFPNTGGGGSTRGPLFVWQLQNAIPDTLFEYKLANGTTGVGGVVYFPSQVETWAVPNPVPAPEPATLAVFGVGLAGVIAARRRRAIGRTA